MNHPIFLNTDIKVFKKPRDKNTPVPAAGSLPTPFFRIIDFKKKI